MIFKKNTPVFSEKCPFIFKEIPIHMENITYRNIQKNTPQELLSKILPGCAGIPLQEQVCS